MNHIISSKTLYQKLILLKDTLEHYNFSALQNIIFINSASFYSYISKINCYEKFDYTIEMLLNDIEHCIPFALTDESFDIFISATQQTNEEKMEALRKGFIRGCKMDFLYLVLGADTQEKWDTILQSCETLRKQKLAE